MYQLLINYTTKTKFYWTITWTICLLSKIWNPFYSIDLVLSFSHSLIVWMPENKWMGDCKIKVSNSLLTMCSGKQSFQFYFCPNYYAWLQCIRKIRMKNCLYFVVIVGFLIFISIFRSLYICVCSNWLTLPISVWISNNLVWFFFHFMLQQIHWKNATLLLRCVK